MALKTNSKIVCDAIRTYLMDNFEDYYNENKSCFKPNDYLLTLDITNYTDVCNGIIHNFYNEKVKHDCGYRANKCNLFSLFENWVSGLCSTIDTAYYYNVSAIDLLAKWLQESDTEKARFSESDAELMITKLLWREITKRADMSIF